MSILTVYTWIKSKKLEEIGIKPFEEAKFRTIEGRVIKRHIGEAIVECLGKRATTTVVFAEENDSEVIGIHALEGLRLEVDPVTKKLREVEVVLAI